MQASWSDALDDGVPAAGPRGIVGGLDGSANDLLQELEEAGYRNTHDAYGHFDTWPERRLDEIPWSILSVYSCRLSESQPAED